MSENSIPKIPNLDLANYRFILNNQKTLEFYDEARTNLFKCIEENSKCSSLSINLIIKKLTYLYILILLNSQFFFFLLELLDMAPFYQLVTEELKIPLDKTLITKYQENNNVELKKLDERLEDAEKNLGETEISDALLAKAEFFSKIG